MSSCLACGALSTGLPIGSCRNHGTPRAVVIEAGGSADGGVYITAKGDLLKEVWMSDPPPFQDTSENS